MYICLCAYMHVCACSKLLMRANYICSGSKILVSVKIKLFSFLNPFHLVAGILRKGISSGSALSLFGKIKQSSGTEIY